ncbi:fibronectin type III domain-containing protein [Micromonospora sp. NPDC002296]|uniref:fibronectin type III domain-containing protein n=1 Tax=Micromonospora sp. NPDC002296 TaxID=3154271 RepID=UPI00332AB985
MTAPPWSSVAPPQPLASAVDPDAAPDPRDGVDRPAEEPDAPYVGWEETGPAPAPPPRSPGPEPSVPRLDASPAVPFPAPPPPPAVPPLPLPVPPSPPRDHRSDATEPGPAALDWAEQQPAGHRPAEHGQGQGQQQEGQAWPERDGWRAADDYPSPPDAWQTTYQEKERTGRGRTVVLVAVVALVALAIVVGVAVLVFGGDEAPPPGATAASASAGPKVSGPPPGGLKLRDDSSTISLTWTDPSSGAVPFMVAGGRTGQKLGVLATVDPGQTSYTVNGLNSRVDYCFTVLAVYSTDAFATSGQVCTARGPAPTPS